MFRSILKNADAGSKTGTGSSILSRSSGSSSNTNSDLPNRNNKESWFSQTISKPYRQAWSNVGASFNDYRNRTAKFIATNSSSNFSSTHPSNSSATTSTTTTSHSRRTPSVYHNYYHFHGTNSGGFSKYDLARRHFWPPPGPSLYTVDNTRSAFGTSRHTPGATAPTTQSSINSSVLSDSPIPPTKRFSVDSSISSEPEHEPWSDKGDISLSPSSQTDLDPPFPPGESLAWTRPDNSSIFKSPDDNGKNQIPDTLDLDTSFDENDPLSILTTSNTASNTRQSMSGYSMEDHSRNLAKILESSIADHEGTYDSITSHIDFTKTGSNISIKITNHFHNSRPNETELTGKTSNSSSVSMTESEIQQHKVDPATNIQNKFFYKPGLWGEKR
ncbi:uncharacterized protein L201_005221 [Kwoniella dendrophila CBS 6074]|uniref:Uncharacterized protein n=1 Tax=Kwoniella dendrophila CBS 6074 TaxID=1295534 RepID=A0AAX4JZN8_9TREE